MKYGDWCEHMMIDRPVSFSGAFEYLGRLEEVAVWSTWVPRRTVLLLQPPEARMLRSKWKCSGDFLGNMRTLYVSVLYLRSGLLFWFVLSLNEIDWLIEANSLPWIPT